MTRSAPPTPCQVLEDAARFPGAYEQAGDCEEAGKAVKYDQQSDVRVDAAGEAKAELLFGLLEARFCETAMNDSLDGFVPQVPEPQR